MIRDITLKYKLILGSMATVFIPFFITGIIIYLLLSRSLVELSQEKSLHIAQGIADLVDVTLTQEIRLAESIASDKDMISASNTGDYSRAQAELVSIYSRIGGNGFPFLFLIIKVSPARMPPVKMYSDSISPTASISSMQKKALQA